MTATKPKIVPIEGIDVSHYQGQIDWHAVRAGGKQFAFAKATENLGTDPRYTHNRTAALAAGVLLGSYHFFHFDSDWSAQAHHFASTVGILGRGELPPVLDLEQQSYRDGKTAVAKVDGARKALAWLGAIKSHFGVAPIVYADRDFISNFLQDAAFAGFGLWVASYNPTVPPAPKPWKKVTFWQYDEHGSAAGVGGTGLDRDRFMGTVTELHALAKP